MALEPDRNPAASLMTPTNRFAAPAMITVRRVAPRCDAEAGLRCSRSGRPRPAGAAFDLSDLPVLHVYLLACYQRYQRRLVPPAAAPVKKKPSSHRTSTI